MDNLLHIRLLGWNRIKQLIQTVDLICKGQLKLFNNGTIKCELLAMTNVLHGYFNPVDIIINNKTILYLGCPNR